MSLDKLTTELETIDKLLVKLIARRLNLLKRIHSHNDALNYPLFQREEERRLSDRIQDLSARFEVNRDLLEGVFRRILDESYRRHMAFTRRTSAAEAPRVVAVIGGTGGMGSFFARIFADRGHTVLIATERSTLTPVEAAAQADLTLIAVPMAATVEVIRQLGPVIKPGGCLADVTSLKVFPLKAMLEHTAPEVDVVGMHPMFGPTVDSLVRQVVVLCPGRGQQWLGWIRQILESQGAILKETTPEVHDKMMAVIQVLRHFSSIAMGKCLEMLKVNLEESLEFTSPIYRLELAMIGRLFAQNPTLYADIEMQNPLSPVVVAEFLHAASAMAGVVVGGDREAFIEHFERTARYFGDFRNRALEESDYLIARLVERMTG